MSHKRIGILTLQNSNNYGAMYQVYALSKFLRNRGHDVFVVDYEMTRDKAGAAGYLKHPVSLLQKIFYRHDLLKKILVKQEPNKHEVSKANEFDKIFKNFRDEFLNITQEKYNYRRLSNSCPKADVFITGSDQVWAADFLFTSPAFLLGFVPTGVKRVSYAASFGKNKLEPYLKNVFVKNIQKFDAISVREKSGVDLVKSLGRVNAQHVVDPTLLLEKDAYAEIIDYSLVPDEPYVFVYKLHQEKELNDWFDVCVNAFKKRDNLTILAVSTNSEFMFDSTWNELKPTPGQLLGLIERSSITITNSFHGTVFSIILRAKFLTLARDAHKDKQNIRMEELLSNLELDKFYCPPFAESDFVYQKAKEMPNFLGTYERLNGMRTTSVNFLDKSLV
jgi:Polysaccharide pyruvyl transferase